MTRCRDDRVFICMAGAGTPDNLSGVPKAPLANVDLTRRWLERICDSFELL